VRDYAIDTTPANVLDWKVAYGFRLSPEVLAAVTVPALVLWGGESHPAARRANKLLGRHIPGASVASIVGAAHFMICTHAPAWLD
jgi:pimeloyl-ACP methyl ester carboxylesterase